jgi:hypothetical protein
MKLIIHYLDFQLRSYILEVRTVLTGSVVLQNIYEHWAVFVFVDFKCNCLIVNILKRVSWRLCWHLCLGSDSQVSRRFDQNYFIGFKRIVGTSVWFHANLVFIVRELPGDLFGHFEFRNFNCSIKYKLADVARKVARLLFAKVCLWVDAVVVLFWWDKKWLTLLLKSRIFHVYLDPLCFSITSFF